MFNIESTLGAWEGATAGSADNSWQAPQEHLEMQQKQPDGHFMRTVRVERRSASEDKAIFWIVAQGGMENKPCHHLTSADFQRRSLSYPLHGSSFSSSQMGSSILHFASSLPRCLVPLKTAYPNFVWTACAGPASNATAATKPSVITKHEVGPPSTELPHCCLCLSSRLGLHCSRVTSGWRNR